MASRIPFYADAYKLPFAEGYFDVLMSINSCTGVYTNGIPEELKLHWSEEINKWHTLNWWVDCFIASGVADILIADIRIIARRNNQ